MDGKTVYSDRRLVWAQPPALVDQCDNRDSDKHGDIETVTVLSTWVFIWTGLVPTTFSTFTLISTHQFTVNAQDRIKGLCSRCSANFYDSVVAYDIHYYTTSKDQDRKRLNKLVMKASSVLGWSLESIPSTVRLYNKHKNTKNTDAIFSVNVMYYIIK